MEKQVRIRVPATSANCGPGFDTLGIACTLYNYATYTITSTPGLELEVQGEGREALTADSHNLAIHSFYKGWNAATGGERVGLRLSMENNIPLSRGLGSSSSAIVAGLYAANCLAGKVLSQDRLLALATEIEGHPDNVAPALYGGLTISYTAEGTPHSLRLLPAKPLKFIAVVPASPLSTSLARQAIPATVPHGDAVFNTARASLLVGALLSGQYQYLAAGLEDRLHQPYRAKLIPGLEQVWEAARQQGAYNAIISGAGSTVMAYAPLEADHEAIGYAMQEAFARQGERSVFHILDLDEEGVQAL